MSVDELLLLASLCLAVAVCCDCGAACIETVCLDPTGEGYDLDPCTVCRCGFRIYEIDLPSVTHSGHDVGGIRFLTYDAGNSTATNCRWTTPTLDYGADEYVWRLSVTTGPIGTLKLIKTDGGETVLATYELNPFACCCQQSLPKISADAGVSGEPDAICLSRATSNGTVKYSPGCCSVNFPTAYAMYHTPEPLPGVLGGAFILRRVAGSPNGWSGTHYIGPYSYYWTMDFDCDCGTSGWVVTVKAWQPCPSDPNPQRVANYTANLPDDFDFTTPITVDFDYADLCGLGFEFWPEPHWDAQLTFTPAPFGTFEDEDGNDIDPPDLEPCPHSCAADCAGTECVYESFFDSDSEMWEWVGVETETPCDGADCFCPIDATDPLTLRDMTNNDSYNADMYQGQQLEFICVLEEEILFP
jgi:hypothetical protein